MGKALVKLGLYGGGLAIIGAGIFWALTAPKKLDAQVFAGLTGDVARGEQVFTAAGCASCHMAPRAQGEEKLVLSGGQRFESPFGTFIAPNISPHPEQGIGGWTPLQIANAVIAGVSPEGQHYYPAFPYASYAHMTVQDAVDLAAYLPTLPVSDAVNQPHELPLPLKLRRGIGLWKLAFMPRGDWAIDLPDLTEAELRGRYLVEGLGHCAECHTPRNITGEMDKTRWLSGVSGKGGAPNITPAKLGWSEGEIAEYLSSGLTPDYDSAGGHMALVVDNYAKLPASDREAVAAYLKRVPAIP